MFFNFKKTRISNTVILNQESNDFQQVKAHREYVAKYPCPNCNQLKLLLIKHTQGAKGWESQVICNNCKSTGLMNSTGIEFNLSGIPEETVKEKVK